MEYPKFEELNNYTEKCIKNTHPEFWKYINQTYDDNLSWTEKLYWYYNNITSHPVCLACGCKVSFKNLKNGYHKFCSPKCARNSKEVKEKIKETNLKKYGVENPFQSEELKEKIKQTNLDKYGVEHPGQSEIVKGKIKQTNLERYGYEYGLSCVKVKEKRKQTCLKKYGVENVFSSTEIKEKIKQTNIEKLGVEYPGQSNTVKEKIKQTNLERYGVKSPLQSQEILYKVEQTNLERYGVKTPLQEEHIKEKIRQSTFNHFGVEHPAQSSEILNKMKKSCIKKYGVDNYSKTNEFLVKSYNSKKENNSFNISTIEDEFSEWLTENNINFIRQYRSDKYPFNCDFYFPNKDLYLEIQGSWTHGDHPYDPDNQSDINIVNKWKEKNTDYYNNAIEVWTKRDPLKRKTAKYNNLNWKEVFTNDPNKLINIVKDLNIQH